MKKIFPLLSLIAIAPIQVYAQGVSIRLENPLSVKSIQDLLVAILNIVMILMIPVIVFFIIYAGFLYVTARGNAEQVKQATRALTYAIIGGVLVVGAFAIAEIIKATVQSFM
jgi:type III secretory pathway component EscU